MSSGLIAAVETCLGDIICTLEKKGEGDVRKLHHLVRNKWMGQLSDELEKLPEGSAVEVSSQTFRYTIETLYGMNSGHQYHNAFKAMPLDLLDWAAKDFLKRFSGRSRRTIYNTVIRREGVPFGQMLENIRAQSPNFAQHKERGGHSLATAYEALLVTEEHMHMSPHTTAGTTTSSSDPSSPSSSSADNKKKRKETTERPPREKEKTKKEEKKLPIWKAIVLSRREQTHRLATLLSDYFQDGSDAPSVLPIKKLFSTACDAGIFPELAAGEQWNEKLEKKLSRAVFQLCQKGTLPGTLTVTSDSVVNLAAMKKEASATNGAEAGGGAAQLTCEILSNGEFDEAFVLVIHLLARNFHFKPKSGEKATAKEYPGHNICCVAIDPQGRYYGFDFNQCKADKNLCSHSEKRLAEAINLALRHTTPEGKPPSLDGWTFITSLEPCHMCANFISRMGVHKIGFLMRDPMQLDALFIAASMLQLTIHRPKETLLGTKLEERFLNSGLPEDEITSWLGGQECLDTLKELAATHPLGRNAQAFYEKLGHHYPGCVLDVQNRGAPVVASAPPEDDEFSLYDRAQSTSTILAEEDFLGSDDDEDESSEERGVTSTDEAETDDTLLERQSSLL